MFESENLFTKRVQLSQICFFYLRWSCKMIGGS